MSTWLSRGPYYLALGVLAAGALRCPVLAQCQVAKLRPQDGAAGDKFGYSVAISRQRLIVGARGDDEHGPGSGSVYVFRRLGAEWGLEAKLRADDGDDYDSFGNAVSLSTDVLVVGAPFDEHAGHASGSAYVFEREADGTWLQVGKLTAGDAEAGDFFGRAVALSADVAVVGSPQDNDLGTDSGSAYVFERDAGGNWSQVGKLTAEDGDSYDRFADAVAVHGDVIVIGAQDDEELGNWSGSAYVFERDLDGTWSQVAKLLADDGDVFDSFGASVAVSGDVGLIGAHNADGAAPYTGAAYVFQRDPTGVWEQTAKLFASDGQNSDFFGRTVALGANVAAIGATGDDDLGWGSGSVYVFVGQHDGAWSQVAKLLPDDGERDDRFGNSVTVSGNIAVIGAYQHDDHGSDSGSAYVFAVGPDGDGDGVMDACECPGDLNHDWIVDYYDLAVLLADWGCTSGDCPGDCDRDGDTDQADLGLLLANWGSVCP